MLQKIFSPAESHLWAAIREQYYADEEACVTRLMNTVALLPDQKKRIRERATALVQKVREGRFGKGGIDAFMLEYELSSAEGVALMCLAEALLRIPDKATADKLIRDKLSTVDWSEHLGGSNSVFVNASTWALMLTGRVMKQSSNPEQRFRAVLKKCIARSGEPVIRQAVRQAMGIMGRQFVLGRHIDEALTKAAPFAETGYRYSFDMLGEAAYTAADAKRYFDAYAQAIKAIGVTAQGRGTEEGPGISVKLSALHPRYEFTQAERHRRAWIEPVRELALMAKQANIGFTVDAEEADRLELQLYVFEALVKDPLLAEWDGLGLAIQAYQKRCVAVIDWLFDLAQHHHRRLMVRLVKGAYWDSEVKRAQSLGLEDYPVFTRKTNTDVSYLACAKKLLSMRHVLYPQFATHNAHTVSAVLELAGDHCGFEFQRLHGMGMPLYQQIVGTEADKVPCRIYAPVGSHEDLLPYLVRRLLENGANSSFVNRLVDDRAPIEEIIADPIENSRSFANKRHPKIPLPSALFPDGRQNSQGQDITDIRQLRVLNEAMEQACRREWHCEPLVGVAASDKSVSSVKEVASTVAQNQKAVLQKVFNPACLSENIGTVIEATPEQCDAAMAAASEAFAVWSAVPIEERAIILERAADRLQEAHAQFYAIAMREAGKTLVDCVAEVREAVDFLRYYAREGRRYFGDSMQLPGPTGEINTLSRHGRGVFACISPWNFPLAIFLGQISAALIAGNTVVAKPAEQTAIMAYEAVKLLHEAGVPFAALQLVPGEGSLLGPVLLRHPKLAGVVFTGGTDTAKRIQRGLAERDGAILPLIAETGGLNAMIVDSSALPEQVVQDVMSSAFQSAGQRCSACRILYLQSDIADRILTLLKGALQECVVGDPRNLNTDVGPVIDEVALTQLKKHVERMEREATLVVACEATPDLAQKGFYFGPRVYELNDISQLEREVFGPILHVIRFKSEDMDAVVDVINGTGYGLTLGVHSRVNETVQRIIKRARVGNLYVNRNQIGAVVGVQPFGGEGLSGTGPKAGGPSYLNAFSTEHVVSIDTTAQGGNASLLTLSELEHEDMAPSPQSCTRTKA